MYITIYLFLITCSIHSKTVLKKFQHFFDIRQRNPYDLYSKGNQTINKRLTVSHVYKRKMYCLLYFCFCYFLLFFNSKCYHQSC